METNKYFAPLSNEARELIEKGFKGNGCGSGFFSHTLCVIAQVFIGADLSPVWMRHDAEYSVSRSIKSRKKKNQADADAEFNINAILRLPQVPVSGAKTNAKVAFAKVIHAALVLGGDNAYWDIKTKPSILRTGITVGILAVLFFKVF